MAETLPECHRMFVGSAYAEQAPAIAGIAPAQAQLKAVSFFSPCKKEKCALFDKKSGLCGDLLQAQSLAEILAIMNEQHHETKITAVS